MNLAIIPARGGSKRIPGKNIKDFLGKPIIVYSIQAAKNCGLFSAIMVSTDNKEIAELAKQHGASVPFIRSAENSDDHATIGDVTDEVLQWYYNNNQFFSNICCILPTAPLITPDRIKEALQLLEQKNYDSVFPVSRYSYPIQRALQLSKGNVTMFQPENFNKRSQDLETAYHDSGTFYWMKTEEFFKQKRFFAANSGAIVLPESEVQDIDNEDDWKLAEIKYKLLFEK